MNTYSAHLKTDTKEGCILLACYIMLGCAAVAPMLGLKKENTFDVLRDRNNLTDLEAFFMLFGQQLLAAIAFTALEIREDFILTPEENEKRGVGTDWPRSRVYQTIYMEFPICWTLCFGLFMFFRGPLNLFLTYDDETWAVWTIKMVLWFVVWEFQMYWFHRVAHSVSWLYKIAHKGHHVVMDFPLGPHAPPLEKTAHYISSIIASQIVGVSASSWVFAINILMTQCVLEHAYSSIRIPIWHDLFCFNTADLHQAHHVKHHVNFGYAFNFFDPIFGTLVDPETFKTPENLVGPATPARKRFVGSKRYERSLASDKST